MEALGESMTTKVKVDLIASKQEIPSMADNYLDDADLRTPLVAPLCADLKGLSSMLMQVGTGEILFDDMVRLADRARTPGVDFVMEPWEDMIHMWHFFPMLPEA